MPARKPARISEKDYLAGERGATERHEYVDGVVYAMSGETQRHNVIVGNLYMALRAHLRGRPCIVTMEGVQVHAAKSKAYYYPDIAVSCPPEGAPPANATYQVEHPTLIVEVLSESTEGNDRSHKWHAYRRLPSLQEYVLVSQDRRQVELFRRKGEIGWLHLVYAPDEDLDLPSVGLVLPMASLYEGTDSPVEADSWLR